MAVLRTARTPESYDSLGVRRHLPVTPPRPRKEWTGITTKGHATLLAHGYWWDVPRPVVRRSRFARRDHHATAEMSRTTSRSKYALRLWSHNLGNVLPPHTLGPGRRLAANEAFRAQPGRHGVDLAHLLGRAGQEFRFGDPSVPGPAVSGWPGNLRRLTVDLGTEQRLHHTAKHSSITASTPRPTAASGVLCASSCAKISDLVGVGLASILAIVAKRSGSHTHDFLKDASAVSSRIRPGGRDPQTNPS